MTTTSASTAAPKPVEASNKPAQANARAQADKPAEADLFASLLSLVSDTHLPPADASPLDASKTPEGDTQADNTNSNPLAALLAWALPPASTPAAPNASSAAATGTADARATPTAALGIDKALADSGVNIEGMTRVDESLPPPAVAAQVKAAATAASRPAFSPLNPGSPAPAGAQASAQAGTPAMVWQRGTGAEPLPPSHHAEAQAQVRSTVALNERFGFSGSPELTAPALRESGSGGLGGPATPATGPQSTQTVTGATGADSTGGDTARDGQADVGTGDALPSADPRAETEAEGTTVSHWGSQHLRHASLRVGGEGGSDAIDIQLSVKGQEVQVAFQTDNAEARASLRESAGESLADLMQRSGIQLGGVSVGGQGQAQGEGAPPPRTIDLGSGNGGRDAPVAESGARPAIAARLDGSRPLDVFA